MSQRFTLENVTFLCDMLASLSADTGSTPEPLVEALRELVEVVVWGDKYDDTIFDMFLECNVVQFYADSIDAATCHILVKIQCLQCVTILLQNLTRQQSHYFLLSNNHINRIIAAELDFTDDEVVAHYISFVKALSIRLNPDTVQFFFTADFPIYAAATQLLQHPDRLVRASVRQIVINIMQLDEPNVRRFMEEHSAADYFIPICEFILSTASKLQVELVANTAPPLVVIDTAVEDVVDDLFYFNDLFGICNDALQTILSEALESRLMLPLARGAAKEPLPLLLLSHWIRVSTVDAFSMQLLETVRPVVLHCLSTDDCWKAHPIALGCVGALEVASKRLAVASVSEHTSSDALVKALDDALRSQQDHMCDDAALPVIAALYDALNRVMVYRCDSKLRITEMASDSLLQLQQRVSIREGATDGIVLDGLFESLTNVCRLGASDAFKQVKPLVERVGRDVKDLLYMRSMDRVANSIPVSKRQNTEVLAILMGRARVRAWSANSVTWEIDGAAQECVSAMLSVVQSPPPDVSHSCRCELSAIDCESGGLPAARRGAPYRAYVRHGSFFIANFATTPTSMVLAMPLVFLCAVVDHDHPFRMHVQVLSPRPCPGDVRELTLVLREHAVCSALSSSLNEAATMARERARNSMSELLKRVPTA
jgi:protein CLEC16A